MFTDFVLNGQGHGEFGEYMQGVHFEPGLSRPFFDNMTRNPKSGSLRWPRERFVTVNAGKEWDPAARNGEGAWKKLTKTFTVKEAERLYDVEVPIRNASTLPKDVWIEIDRRIQRTPRQRLRFYSDVASRNRRTVDGMGKTMVEYQAIPDFGEAIQDMDGISDVRRDRPPFTLKSMPLPVTHFGAEHSQREIAASRNGGGASALDLINIEMGGRRVAEMIEKVGIGVETGITAGPTSSSDSRYTGSSVNYGATNYPYRVTKTDLHTPSASSPEQITEDVLEMIETMQTNGYYGPYVLYHSTPYSRFLNDDYFRTGGTAVTRTPRERLLAIDDIVDIRRLDYLTSGYQLLLFQMDADVVEAIDGMEITTVQWSSKGGMKQNLEVMAIKALLFRSPSNGVAGYVHGTTS